jgi:CBS domain
MDQTQSQTLPADRAPVSPAEPVPLLSPSDLVKPMLRAGDVLTAGSRTCSTASTVLEADLIFRDADCGIVPITEEGRPIGVLTDRDVALALPEHEDDLAATPVRGRTSADCGSQDGCPRLGLAVDQPTRWHPP